MSDLSRRGFIQSVAAAGAAGVLVPSVSTAASASGTLPSGVVVVASANGIESVKKAGL
ncbi:MAG: twin-arginine translocation signal domain-containing protein, partial [Planctomycetes bacterium]|nr:twin-arginine translocation signal domain-containing protein [Planctomycetota bacterium]